MDEAKKEGYGGRVAHDMHVSWKVSVKCELDRVGFPGNDDDSDDDLVKEMNNNLKLSEDVVKALTPTKPGGT